MATYITTQDLTSDFAKLPQLQEICFARWNEYDRLVDGPKSFDLLSSVARDTLVQPELWARSGSGVHAGNFTALLNAAHKVLKSFENC